MPQTEYNYADRAMGCDCDLAIIARTEHDADRAYGIAMAMLAAEEALFSRFRPTSALARLNRTGSITPPSRHFSEVVHLARTLHERTDGAFNPLVQIARHGYTRSFEDLAAGEHTASGARPDTDFAHVTITPTRITLGPSQCLDVAGFLKGLTAERIAATLIARDGISGVVVNLGGDIATRGTDATGDTFAFSVDNPVTGADIPLTLRDTCLATSGTYRRRWRTTRGMHHHILAPATHENPATDLVSASVITPSGARADAYATAAIVLGRADAVRMLRRERCHYILIDRDGAITAHVT